MIFKHGSNLHAFIPRRAIKQNLLQQIARAVEKALSSIFYYSLAGGW